jgi:hypothetical protein
LLWIRLLANLTIWLSRRVSYKKQDLLTIHNHMGSSPICWCDPSCLSFSFLCCFVYLRSVSCVQCCQCFWIVHYWLSLWLTFIQFCWQRKPTFCKGPLTVEDDIEYNSPWVGSYLYAIRSDCRHVNSTTIWSRPQTLNNWSTQLNEKKHNTPSDYRNLIRTL